MKIQDLISFEIFDEDLLSNDSIGSCQLRASALFNKDDWYTIEFEGKSAGKLRLKSLWTPNQTIIEEVVDEQTEY